MGKLKFICSALVAAVVLLTMSTGCTKEEVVSSIKLSHSSVALSLGETVTLIATVYPEDAVACINAASANIVSGDFQNAEKLLEKVKDDNRAWNNLGVLAWLRGDFQAARDWFNKAMSVEPEKAKANLETVNIYDPVQE